MAENSKLGADGGAAKSTADIPAAENPNPADTSAVEGAGNTESNATRPSRQSSRTPFTDLCQLDADLALARTLQEQERAYMMLRFNSGGSDYGSWEVGSYYDDEYGDPDGHEYDDIDDDDDDEDEVAHYHEGNGDEYLEEDDDDDEDAFDVHANAESAENNITASELDPSSFPDDEAYARALQDAEEREMAARLLAMAGITETEVEDLEDHGENSQDAWEEVDPDELSYEELIALGEVVGTASRGLSAETIASLPLADYKPTSAQEEERETCVICRMEYEEGDKLTVLSCKHSYHPECINDWLKINKVCPVCSVEVSSSETTQ